MNAKRLMVGGTASHVGKSWMATAVCAWLRRRGVRVVPFKAQNMSNNSYPCPQGGEIGRAQVAQARACGLEPSPDMNPILLKPTGEMESQIVVQGKVWKTLKAREYYRQHEFLLAKVQESFDRLAAEYEFIVLEGAGSVAEMNLRDTDLVNLELARRLQAPVLLVADIDRGGVFAAVYGTLALLDSAERDLVKAFAVNRFRGDPSLFDPGVRYLEEKTGKPCLGVFPYIDDVLLDEEDSVSLIERTNAGRTINGRATTPPPNAPRIAILRLPTVSNFTDFRLLPWADWIDHPPRGEGRYDVVILPGCKNSLAALAWMRRRGLDGWVRQQNRAGAFVIGICGGYQILGNEIRDPHRIESDEATVPGLGLLPVVTTFRKEKTTEVVDAVTAQGTRFRAYEIHMGATEKPADAAPFALIHNKPEGHNRPEGIHLGKCIGTYLHGALENERVVEELIGFRPVQIPSAREPYERLADWFETSADVKFFEQAYLGP